MAKRRIPIVLINVTSISPELQESVGRLKYVSSEKRAGGETAALARLLARCPNIASLELASPHLVKLVDDMQGACMGRLRRVFVLATDERTAQDFVKLLNWMPGLRHVGLLPLLDGTMTQSSIDMIVHLHLDSLSLTILQPGLALLRSRRWTARSVSAIINQDDWQHFDSVSWPALPELEGIRLGIVHRSPDASGPAPAVAFVAACNNLRRLDLTAFCADLREILPPIFAACRVLQGLEVRFRGTGFGARAVPAPLKEIEPVVAVLLENLPRTLRSLGVNLAAAEQAPLFEKLETLCRRRRVVCRTVPNSPYERSI